MKGWALGLVALGACGADVPCEVDDGETLGALTAWEEAWLASEGVPSSPAPDFLEAEDGLPLAYRDWIPASEPTGDVVILVPGSSAHGAQYAVLGQGLAEAGVRARLLDVRGHGLSVCAETGCGAPEAVARAPADDARTWVGRVGDSADVQQIVRDLGRHVADVLRDDPDARVHLVGHSSGGGVVSRFVETTGAAGIRSVVLLAPYNHPDQPQIRPEVRLDCPTLAGTSYARVDLGALGAALRGDVHRFVLRFHKSPTFTDPLDTLAYTWTTMTGMATTDPVGFWDVFDLPVLLVAAEEDHLLDPDRAVEEVARARDGHAWRVSDTSHVGLAWRADVAAGLAAWITEGQVPEDLGPPAR